MVLDPIAIYDKAVQAVPTVKWAMAVAGVIAAGAIALMVVNEDPRKAFFVFLTVAAAMLLMMIISGAFPGPRTCLVWAITVCFVVCLLLTITAYAIGCPINWAELVGARPNCPWHFGWNEEFERTATDMVQNAKLHLRGFGISEARAEPQRAIATTPVSNAPVACSSASSQARAPSHVMEQADEVRFAQRGATTFIIAQQQPSVVERSFVVRESSDNCSVRKTISREFCLNSGVQVRLDRTRISVQSTNCGSRIDSSRAIPDKPNCLMIDVWLQGCGYDRFFGLQNCRGRGWIDATITVSGVGR